MVLLGIRLAGMVLPFEAHRPGNTFATNFLLTGIMGIIRDTPSRGRTTS
jgi:hypothetical protein